MRTRPVATARLAALAALAVGAFMPTANAAAPITFPEADERLYMQRFEALANAMRFGAGLERYDPLVPLKGAQRYTPLPAAKPAERTISDEALAAAHDYAERNNSDALVVWRNGRIETEAYFGGHTRETPIVGRSLAKPMTAAAVGRAIALGKIRSLDQPVADFVTEWKGDPVRGKILVCHLLNMHSGFLEQANATTPEDILNRAYLHPHHDEIIVREYPVPYEPGTRYEYNNATAELVAVLIERATGRKYEQFIADEVLKPIGAMGGQIWLNRPGGTAHAGCCLLIPPESWVRLAVLFMQDGRWDRRQLLPPGYVAQMRQPSPGNPYYGLGVYLAGTYTDRRGFANPAREPRERRVLHSEPYLAKDVFLFDGNANQVVFIVPSQKLVILRTGNPPPRAKDGSREWDNSFLPNTILRGIRRKPGERLPEPQPRA